MFLKFLALSLVPLDTQCLLSNLPENSKDFEHFEGFYNVLCIVHALNVLLAMVDSYQPLHLA